VRWTVNCSTNINKIAIFQELKCLHFHFQCPISKQKILYPVKSRDDIIHYRDSLENCLRENKDPISHLTKQKT
jgi:hypothetical protein